MSAKTAIYQLESLGMEFGDIIIVADLVWG
jgi:hypothetical protein